MNVLVTGANGFIGQNLVHRLEERGFRINALVRNRGKLNTTSEVNIFEGDILNDKILREASVDVETVFHLVAKTHDFSNANATKDYFEINVDGTRNLLDACVDSEIKRFVFFSSVKTMVEDGVDTLDEAHVSKPVTVYGETKLMAERLISDYGNKYGFKTTSLRLPLVYGPGVKGNIYKMIKAIDNGRFVMMGNGLNKRSMVYVGNVVDAALSVVDCEAADGKVYLITDGIDYTVRDLYKLIAKGLNRKPLSFYVPMAIAKMLAITGDIGSKLIRRPLPFDSDVLGKLAGSLTFSSRRIQDEIGFKPEYNLYNTIDETIKWYKTVRHVGHR